MKPLLETLKAGTGYLEKHGVDEARLNMEHLLAHVLGCRRLDLYLRFNESIHETDLEKLRGLTKRRSEGEPLQHLLGSVEFCGHEFVSDHRALVPRPETETLVELLEKRFKSTPPATVLDVGTGSGCIGLSLSKAWRDAATTLIDISEDALELARLNASRLSLNGAVIRFIRSDLFEKIDASFDLIVANLPYIPRAEIATLTREVRRDPATALDGGADGLEIITRLITGSAAHLNPSGTLALELGHDQSARVLALCETAGLEDCCAARDLAGIERFVFARQPQGGACPLHTTASLPDA